MSSAANAHPDRAIDLDGGLPQGDAKAVAVRKMFDTIGHSVVKLKRVAIGHIDERWLKVGESRNLTPEEVKGFRNPVQKSSRSSTN